MKKEYKQIGITVFNTHIDKLKYLRDEGLNISHEFRQLVDKIFEEQKIKEIQENLQNNK